MKKVLLIVIGLLLLIVLIAAAGLTWAHLDMQSHRPPIANVKSVAALSGEAGPVRVTMINTATQPMPRSAVLDPVHDPTPEQRYLMSHPSFVLEWSDGRRLLIDAGMTRDGAAEFGGMIEMLGEAEPIEVHGSVAEQLGPAVDQVEAIVFTHLHVDHVGGIRALCEKVNRPLRVFMTTAQAERSNFTTRPGRTLLEEASCARVEVLDGGRGALRALDGFPGVAVMAAAGHTPGSQLIFARTNGARLYAFAGDIANNIDGIRFDIPKPYLYRLLVVPEDDEQMKDLRRFLRELGQSEQAILLPAHDRLHAEQALAGG